MNGEWFPCQPGSQASSTLAKSGASAQAQLHLVAVLAIAEHRGGDQSDIGNLSFGRRNEEGQHVPHSADLHLVGQ